MYPWSGVGVWPAIMEIPNERFNETLTLTIYNTNHTDDPSKTYFSWLMLLKVVSSSCHLSAMERQLTPQP